MHTFLPKDLFSSNIAPLITMMQDSEMTQSARNFSCMTLLKPQCFAMLTLSSVQSETQFSSKREYYQGTVRVP